MEGPSQEIVLVRHGRTEWSEAGRHTGRTDVLLLEEGRAQARAIGPALAAWTFGEVLTSPLARAAATSELAGFGDVARIDADLREWDYGAYEGLTTAEIRRGRPGWTVWIHGPPGGETAADVGLRADRVIALVDEAGADVALFSHGHFLRVLTARWLGLAPQQGRLFRLDTATISVLGFERETRVIRRWNDGCHLEAMS